MDNYAIAENFSLLSKLMDIHGDNSFKARIYGAAAFNIEKLPNQLADTPEEKIASIKGIGDSTAKKIAEMLETGKLGILHEYIEKTPPGVIEMLNIKGIGPKKIQTIWKEMGIESVGELLYACNENRLTLYKGFGEKTQANVQESIEFYQSQQGHFLYAEAEVIFPQINSYLQKLFSTEKVHVTGAYRRQALTIEEMEFVVLENNDAIKPKFQTAQPPELLEEKDNTILYKLKNGLKLRLHTGKGMMDERLFTTSCSEDFLKAFQSSFPFVKYSGKEIGDDSVFTQAKIPVIPAFMRETAVIIEKAKNKKLGTLIQPEDVKAIIHSHSRWSDGDNTLEQMAEECIKKGLEYLVISDHSKTAVYANGLTEERIREQHKQIDLLNEQYKPFKIFRSIECDILGDGSMDYSNNILSTFDLVIASVHSNLKMPEEKAMMRLMKAIENPYTTILGHMTGRLLLSRNGYPVDHKKIIDACAANHVVIELNAHPRRLDIDWRYIDYAIDKGVLISIDPDAHSLDGYNDIRYGVLAAQKAGLTKEQNLSSFSLKEFEKFLADRKKKKKDLIPITMENIKIATAQFENKSNDKEYNLSIIDKLSKQAADKGARMIAFHECSITGYTFARNLSRSQMLELAEIIPAGKSIDALTRIAEKNNIAILAGLFEKDKDDNLFKAYVCADKHGLVAKHRKLHPFINQYLTAGDQYTVFEFEGWKCGMLICYDNNVIENVRATALLGANIIFMPHVTMCTPSTRPGAGIVDPQLWKNRNNDPVTLRKEFDGSKGREWLMKWLPARAYDNGIYAVFSNPIGMDDDQLKNGCSMIIDPFGDVIAECRALDDEFVIADLSPEKLTQAGGFRYTQARRPELYKDVIGRDHVAELKISWLNPDKDQI